MKGFFSKIGKQKFIALAAVAMLLVAAIAITVGVTLIRSDNSEEPYTVSNYGTIQGKFTDISINNEENAIEAVRDAAEILGLGNAAEELTVNRTDTVDNLTYYRLDQNYKGIPVYGSSFVVVADENGEALCLSSHANEIDESISITPIVTQEQINSSIAAEFEGISDIEVPEITNDMLVIYVPDNKEATTLAYELYITVGESNYRAIVSAIDGECLFKITLDYSNASSLAIDKGKNIIICDGKEEIFDFDTFDFDNNIAVLSDKESKADLLLEYLQFSYNFFLKLNREGFNNKNGKTYAVYDCKFSDDENITDPKKDYFNSDNAYCSNNKRNSITYLRFGRNSSISIDVVGHEYMHAVEFSRKNSMNYQGESGAIMEAYSDIFGELIENEYYKQKGCDWVHDGEKNIRNIKNPDNQVSMVILPYPIKYKGKGWYSTTNAEDNGGVHINCTVISHAAYLMTQTNDGFTALTTDELAKLWYETLLFITNPDCSFSELRNYMETTAVSIELSEKKQARVSSAFDAAGIYCTKEQVSNSFDIYIINPDDREFYKSCKIVIEGIAREWKNEFYQKEIIPIGKITEVSLERGDYTILIKSVNSDYTFWWKQINVKKSNKDKNVIVYLDDVEDPTQENTIISETTFTPEITVIPETTITPETTEIPETLPPMEQLFTVTGKVVKFDGKTPHVGAIVNISNDSFEAKGVVDNNGFFSVEIPNGDYRFSITASESAGNKYTFTSGWGDNFCHVADSGVNFGAFKISTVLRGIVTEGTPGSENYGESLEGVKVSVLTSNEQKKIGESYASNYYDSSGKKSNYAITFYSPGTYDLIFSKEGYQDFVLENYVVDINSDKIHEVSLIKTDSVIVPETTEHIHHYSITKHSATCIAEGVIISLCYCGDIKEEILPIVDHNLVNNICSMCGYEFDMSNNGLEIKVYNSYCEIIGIGSCKNKDVILPDTFQGLPVTKLSDGVFMDCDFLESVYIPASIIEITGSRFTNSPFRNCPNLKSIEVDPNNTIFHSSGNCLIITERKLLIAGCKNSILPNDGSVKTIGYTAFMGSSIERVIIPDSVTVVGMSAFYKCNNLKYLYLTANSMNTLDAPIFLNRFPSCPIKEVVIADDFTDLEKLDFNTLKSLTVITLGKGISVIKSNDFYRVSELTTLNLNNTIERIEENAFVSCSNLTAINFNGTLEQWEAINKNNGWDSGIGNYTVYCLDGKIKK